MFIFFCYILEIKGICGMYLVGGWLKHKKTTSVYVGLINLFKSATMERSSGVKFLSSGLNQKSIFMAYVS